MIKTLKISATALALTAVAATSAFAKGEPWNDKRPEMTEAQLATVQAADALRQKLPEGKFGKDPETRNWKWRRGVLKKVPLSNIEESHLRKLVTGNYRIMNENGSTIQYFGSNGVVFNCYIKGTRASSEPSYWSTMQTAFGLSGLGFSLDPNFLEEAYEEKRAVGWPVVGNSQTGELYIYAQDKRIHPRQGWVQKEIPAVALEVCPDMPNNGKVNQDQASGKFSELLKHAKPITGFKTSFTNDPKDPATAGMLYYFYKPTN